MMSAITESTMRVPAMPVVIIVIMLCLTALGVSDNLGTETVVECVGGQTEKGWGG